VTATSQADSEVKAITEVQIAVAMISPSGGDATNTTDADDTTIPTVVSSPFPAIPNCPSTGAINGMCNNHEQVLKNATIGSDVSVVGGRFEGNIENQGIVSQVTVETNAVLKGGKLTGYIVNKGTLTDFEFVGASVTGGILSGAIINNSQVNGVFIDVHLAENTRIDGGTVQGEISGEPEAPAILTNVNIKSESRLSNVIIGDNVQLPKKVMFGEGLRFTHHADIPTGVELIRVLPDLLTDEVEGVNYPKRADFSADVLEPSDGILYAINQLPDFK